MGLVGQQQAGHGDRRGVRSRGAARSRCHRSLSGVRGDSELFTFLRYDLARVSIETVTQMVEDSGDVLDQAVLQFRGLTGTFWRQLPDGSASPPLSIEIGNPPH